MGLLIAIELFSLRFAMNTLSSVRAFVGGEGLWSKAQKSAVLNLEKYGQTHDDQYYQNYLQSLQVPMGDRQAREEMAKSDPDYAVIYDGFVKGKIDYNDIAGLIELVRRFHSIPVLNRALVIWEEGDRQLRELTAEAEVLHKLIIGKAEQTQIRQSLKRIERLDLDLTELENNFSYALGEGSRWLENLLLMVLLLAVLTVESTGLLLTISFSRNLSRDLKELTDTTALVGQGDFTKRIPVRSKDEIGQLAMSVNAMTEQLATSIGGQKQAEKASEVKSMFLANMSHEIRTPLGAMLGFTELLRDPNLNEKDRLQYIEIILRTGNNLSKILHDILDLSKVEAGQIEIEKTRFSLPRLLKEIREMMEIKCSEKGIQLNVTSEDNVPEFIFSDALRLRQILMNIIGNAVKFTDKGEIKILSRVENQYLVFLIEDSGIGLNEEQSKKLFQAFSQADNSEARKVEGTGLGLVLSRRLASLLGGDVTLARSTPGAGSLFVVRISLEVAPLNNSTVIKNSTPDEMPFLKDKNILVVDDAPDNRILIEKMLTKRKAKVEQASNGAEGMEKALAGKFDLILMDVQMPVMDGYTAVAQLRQKGYAGPIVAITAHAMTGERGKCLAAGYSEYLTKPIQTAEFFKILAQQLA